MGSFFEAGDRAGLLERLERLRPDSPAVWGKFTVGKMLRHLADALRMVTGEVRTAPLKGPIGWPPVRWFIIHVMPWKRGFPTAPELIPAVDPEFEAARADLRYMMERVAGWTGELHPHPAFGRMGRGDWGVLIWRHVDHHLKQFGV